MAMGNFYSQDKTVLSAPLSKHRMTDLLGNTSLDLEISINFISGYKTAREGKRRIFTMGEDEESSMIRGGDSGIDLF